MFCIYRKISLLLLLVSFLSSLISCQNHSAIDIGGKVSDEKKVIQPPAETHADNQTTQQPINIISPTEGSRVCMRTLVRGTISNPNLQVFVLIHPMATDRFWVEPIPNMRPDGRWEAYCYFGKPNEGIGNPFEIIAIASENRRLFEEGDELPSPLPDNPEVPFRSYPIIVTRDRCLQ